MLATKFTVVILGLASTAAMAPAASILIDFETQGTGSSPTIEASDPSLTAPVVFSTTDSSDITISDLSSVSGAINFGTRSISAGSPILIVFPTAVSSVSLEAGHSDGTSYSLTLQAFASMNGSGTALGSDTEPLPAIGDLFNSTTLEVDEPDIFSAEITGGGSGVFLDNVALTTGSMGGGGGTSVVPLPSSLAMFPAGAACAGLVILRNRRRIRTA